MTVMPPEPRLVHWYFANRQQASYETGYTGGQLTLNNWFWSYLCIHQMTPTPELVATETANANPPVSVAAKIARSLPRNAVHKRKRFSGGYRPRKVSRALIAARKP